MISSIPSDVELLVGLHLSLPLGYIDSAQFFCTTTETIANITNDTWHDIHSQPTHPLEAYPNTPTPPSENDSNNGIPTQAMNSELQQLCASLPASAKSDLLCYVDVYMDDFCLLAQGDTSIRDSTRRHLFHVIDRVFRPNDGADSVR